MAFVLIGIVGPQQMNVNVHMHVDKKSALQVPGHCLVGPFFAPPARKSKKQPLPSTKPTACCGGDFGPLFVPSETGHAWGNSKKLPRSFGGAKISSIQVLLDFIHSIRDFDSSSIMAF